MPPALPCSEALEKSSSKVDLSFTKDGGTGSYGSCA